MKVSEQIAIMKAYENGKTVEQRIRYKSEWKILDYVENYPFDFVSNEYRIATELKYRPYKSAEECFEEMQKHQPFGWVKNEQMKFNIVCIRPNGTVRTVINNGIYNSWYSFKDSFQLKFIDGTPFGIKE